MKREQILARLLRALSGKTQEEIGEEIGVHPTLVAQFELGKVLPGGDHLERLAGGAGLTVPDAEEILRLYETLRRSRRRRDPGTEDLLAGMVERLRSHGDASCKRLLTLPLPGSPPQAGDRERAAELFARLEELSEEMRPVVVRVAEEYQSWALCEKVCAAAIREAARDVERAAAWTRLAREIAERVRGPEGWRSRIRGYAMAHEAGVLHAAGELEAAEATFEQAKRLWHAGSDPYALLDPARRLGLEGACQLSCTL